MRETPSIAQHCVSTGRDGAPCTAQAGTFGVLHRHAPGAQEARRKGGHATSGTERAGELLPARLQPVVSILESALGEVRRGELDPHVGDGQLGRCPGACHHGRRVGGTIEGAGGSGCASNRREG